jgi:hypothetical protein
LAAVRRPVTRTALASPRYAPVSLVNVPCVGSHVPKSMSVLALRARGVPTTLLSLA